MKKFSKEVRKGLLDILNGQKDMFRYRSAERTLSEKIEGLQRLIEKFETQELYKEWVSTWKVELAAYELMREAIKKALA